MTKRQMQRLHNKLCRQLGIPPTEVVPLSIEMAKETGCSGWFRYDTREIYIYRHGSVTHGPEWMIAHETKHWADYYNGHLTATHYRGKLKRRWRQRGPWSSWPWERAANRFANKQMETKYD